MASCDRHAAAVCTLRHDPGGGGQLRGNQRVHVQAALLYSCPHSGRRMVRVHNLCLMVADQMQDVFRLADLDAIFAANLQVLLSC